VFGVDLGTAKICVAAVDARGLPQVLPDPLGRQSIAAVLSFHADGTVLVGADAVPQRLTDPRNTIFGLARLLGRPASSREALEAASRVPFAIRVGPGDQPIIATRAGDMDVTAMTAFLLEHTRRSAQLATGSDARRAVLTVPAMWGREARAALTTAATSAGFEVEQIVDAPLAIACAWAYGRAVAPLALVYDLGAGKLECSVVEIASPQPRILGTTADSMIGGDELDARIVDTIVRAFWQVHQVDLRADAGVPLVLAREAEVAKRELSGLPEVKIHLTAVARAANGIPLDLDLTLTRETLSDAVSDLAARALVVAEEALATAGVGKDQLGDILMVGGVTRLPFIRESLTRCFGRPPRTDVPWSEGCALGAAIWGAHDGLPDPRKVLAAKRVTSNFGSHNQQAKPSEAKPIFPLPARVARVHTKRMFTVVSPDGLPAVTFSAAMPLPMLEGFDPGSTALPGPAAAAPIMSTLPGAPASLRPPRPPVAPPLAGPRSSQPMKLVEALASRLAISTVGGFCDEIMSKDLILPAAKSRVFSTSKDAQRTVSIQVCQGDSRRYEENRALGILLLDNLPARPRGAVQIEVTFAIDQDGVLLASAKDQATGRAQSVEIRLKA
jgi:molecular chaperone DnaK (HSP70)